MRAACRASVHRDINQNMIQALVETRLLCWQIAAQPVAVRMSLARRMLPMPVRCRVVIMIAARIRFERSHAAGAILVVHIMPATSKHCMDEQRSTQQAGKNGPHRSVNHNRREAAGFIPALGIYLIQTFDKPSRPSTFKTPTSRHNRHFCRSMIFSGLCAARSIELCPRSPTRSPSISAHSFHAVSKSCRYDKFFAA
jgi:hypothetical protein